MKTIKELLCIVRFKGYLEGKKAEAEILSRFAAQEKQVEDMKAEVDRLLTQAHKYKGYYEATCYELDLSNKEIARLTAELTATKTALQNQMQCVGELKMFLHNAKVELAAEREKGKRAVTVFRDTLETLQYLENYVSNRGLSAEDDCVEAIKLIKDFLQASQEVEHPAIVTGDKTLYKSLMEENERKALLGEYEKKD
jgi:hypothetical protein